MNKRPLPLSGIRVLDLTRARAGPTGVRILADWGADVIKIEVPTAAVDEMGGPRDGSDFQNLHRNKRGLSLNLKEEKGRQIFLKLARKADVVVENYRPGVKFRLGIDYETLRKENPRLIYGSISGFGQDGPYANRPGFDQIAQGMSGIMSVTGLSGQGPVRAGIPVADLSTGHACAQGILLALFERERTGEGQWVKTSLLQAMISMMDFQAARWLVDHQAPAQAGNDHPTSIPTGVFTTADGHMNIAASGQGIWRRLLKAIGAEALEKDPRFSDGERRSENRKALTAALNEALKHKTSAEWIELLNGQGVPCGPIYQMDQTFADPQVQHLGMAQAVTHSRFGKMEILANPIELSLHSNALRMPTPEVGEHNREILLEVGVDEAELESLKTKGII